MALRPFQLTIWKLYTLILYVGVFVCTARTPNKRIKQSYDQLPLPPRDDTCGPIRWHLLDDKGFATADLE
jgi:hypothetical protein